MIRCLFLLLAGGVLMGSARADSALRERARDAMRRAGAFYYNRLAVHGGYVYYYSPDLQTRWGEGLAAPTQIWVQPPGTPTVGMAFLKAYAATGDRFYRKAALDAGTALVYGQLESGGWQNLIDFNPAGRVYQYRNGRGGGKNYSSFDDGQSQSAIRFLIRLDEALDFKNATIHEATLYALDAVLAAQFPNGGFPQVWTGPVESKPVVPAAYPDYDWRTEGRIKNYWDMYTLNDNVCGYLAEMLTEAYRVYDEPRFLAALRKLGDFLLLAQMPDPQPGWAQQYNYKMQPIWARAFEPPAIASDESQEVIATLMAITRVTQDAKYLEPIPRALVYLKQSLLADGRLARYYELKTNRPLYMVRDGDGYALTFDDADLPDHYGWKIEPRLEALKAAYTALRKGAEDDTKQRTLAELETATAEVIEALDDQGRWISIYRGEALVGQPKFKPGSPYLSSEVFSNNLERLSDYLIATKSAD